MIKFLKTNDINGIQKGHQLKHVLFKVEIDKPKTKKAKRMPLNISLAIDVSSSMNEGIGNQKFNALDGYRVGGALNYLENLNGVSLKTKLTQVKKAALEAIDLLEYGDFISIVTFSNDARVVQEAVEISENTKESIKRKISSISANGGTNLHEGWLKASVEVAKNMNSKMINRVIVLTDGETNQGITSVSEIAKNVDGLSQRGISTSTFGVGDHYNEDLLEKIATISGGNAYYIENENDISSLLLTEFSCLNNIEGNAANITFNLKEDVKVKCLNELDKKKNSFVIGNLIGGKKISVLMSFEFDNKVKVGSNYIIGDAVLSYVNKDGETVEDIIELVYETLSSKDFNEQKCNEEIEVQLTILEMAKKQKMAKEEFMRGNRNAAYDILSGSIMSAQAYAGNALVAEEMNQVNNLMKVGESYSDVKMSKVLSSMSYSTRTSRK
jgi:Ca-activated chloride channel homolog